VGVGMSGRLRESVCVHACVYQVGGL